MIWQLLRHGLRLVAVMYLGKVIELGSVKISIRIPGTLIPRLCFQRPHTESKNEEKRGNTERRCSEPHIILIPVARFIPRWELKMDGCDHEEARVRCGGRALCRLSLIKGAQNALPRKTESGHCEEALASAWR